MTEAIWSVPRVDSSRRSMRAASSDCKVSGMAKSSLDFTARHMRRASPPLICVSATTVPLSISVHGAQYDERDLVGQRQQLAEQFDRSGIAPVHIVKDQYGWMRGKAFTPPVVHQLVQLALERVAVKRRCARLDGKAEEHFEHLP